MPSIPVIGLVLMLTVDCFIGMSRTVGDCVATVVVATAWEGDLNKAQARAMLANLGVDPTALGVVSEEDGVKQKV